MTTINNAENSLINYFNPNHFIEYHLVYLNQLADQTKNSIINYFKNLNVPKPIFALPPGNYTVITGWGQLVNHCISLYRTLDSQERSNALKLLIIDLINFVYSAISISGFFLKKIQTLPFITPIGAISCLGGLYFESKELKRSIKFLRLLNTSNDVTQVLLRLNEKYFSETPVSHKDPKTRLALRVQPWCQEKIEKEISSILRKLRSADPTTKNEGDLEAKELLETLKIQGKKTLIIHALAVIGFALNFVGFLGLVVGCPYAIIPACLLAGAIFTFTSSTYASVTLSKIGWAVDFTLLIPGFLHPYLFSSTDSVSVTEEKTTPKLNIEKLVQQRQIRSSKVRFQHTAPRRN